MSEQDASRTISQTPATEQGGLPSAATDTAVAGAQAPAGQGRLIEDLDNGTLLISGVNTGPGREERRSLTPTEERARLTLREAEAKVGVLDPAEPTDADQAVVPSRLPLDQGD